MGMLSILFFPLASVTGFMVAYWKNLLTFTHAAIFAGAAVILYLVLMAYLLGIFDHCTVVEKSRGPYTYYYRHFQGQYHEAIMTFHNLFTKDQVNTIYAEPGLLHMSLYWDDPMVLQNPNHCRTTTGFLIPPNGAQNAVKILDGIGFEKAELPPWTAAESSLRVRIMAAYGIAPMKLIPKIAEYSEQKYPDLCLDCMQEHAIYEICEGTHTTYGLVISESRGHFEKLVPFKKPPISEKGKAIIEQYQAKLKKAA